MGVLVIEKFSRLFCDLYQSNPFRDNMNHRYLLVELHWAALSMSLGSLLMRKERLVSEVPVEF